MKSTKVQNPQHIYTTYQANNTRLLVTPRSVAVLPDQFSLLLGLATLACLVWYKAETAIYIFILLELSSTMINRHTASVAIT